MRTCTLRSFLAIVFATCFAFGSTRATTVIAPTFDEIVQRAEIIFQGSVTEMRSVWLGEGSERRIVTYVTFSVEDSIKGDAASSYTITMLGGAVDGRTMRVADAPEFKLGDHDILFVEDNGRQFVPLVGIMHGRYRLLRTAGSDLETVVSDSGLPVTAVKTGARVATSAAHGAVGLTSEDFKAAIRAQLNHAH